jgi:hypothetical protein
MKQLKQLYDATRERLGDQELGDELEKALKEAEEFLTTVKTFEYEGTIKFRGSVPTLTDISTDLDDVFKLLTGCDTAHKIECRGQLLLVIYDEPATAVKAA